MVELFGGVALPTIIAVVNLLGLPGLVLIIWSADQRRMSSMQMLSQEERARESKLRQEEMAALKEQFMAAMAAAARQHAEVVRMYENNTILTKDYARVTNELMTVIHLSTQTITKLNERIDNNMSCPIVREGGNRWALTQRD
jgi:N-acetylmuramoyl-L-alanine amidase CwlA